jgi:hypothetical protein
LPSVRLRPPRQPRPLPRMRDCDRRVAAELARGMCDADREQARRLRGVLETDAVCMPSLVAAGGAVAGAGAAGVE